ncbi:unnamed protein product [Ranitomeya imitator]|uniref:Reelin n=1 Tax=Ranitomeya imitator TaxID=111125 RepID=A0ABN9MBJ9_9NEOB|nr:unnamed protein product [Ranitomeya imitator]
MRPGPSVTSRSHDRDVTEGPGRTASLEPDRRLQRPGDRDVRGATQFRWIQKGDETEKQSWAVDHVYIGEACPKLCSGHGYCTTGAVCICDEGYQDNFESEKVTEINWENIQGGTIGNGCGQLAPYAHGDSLYFNGCQIRQAITKPLDLTRASKIMFVLQIGSIAQTESCNTNLSDANTVDKAVLLQYSVNNGITWQVIAQHQPKDFIQAQRVSYNIPLECNFFFYREARMKGVLLRWWQPRHNGSGHDQWALDHVEVVLSSSSGGGTDLCGASMGQNERCRADMGHRYGTIMNGAEHSMGHSYGAI